MAYISNLSGPSLATAAAITLFSSLISLLYTYSRKNYDASDSNNFPDHSDSDYDDDDSGDDEKTESATKKLRKHGSLFAYLKTLRVLLPYLIPKDNTKVLSSLGACVLTLLCNRVLNVLVPRQLGFVTDKVFTGDLPHRDLAIYLAMELLESNSGLCMIEKLVKLPIQRFSYTQLTNAAFNHVMSQSADFHSERDTAEVMKAIEQGDALTRLFETAVLDIAPTIIDTTVAFVFFYVKFGGMIVASMMLGTTTYLAAMAIAPSWNIDNRRSRRKAEREEARLMHQAVQGWRTVSAFNMFSYERNRFSQAVDAHLDADQCESRVDAYISAIVQAIIPVTFFLVAFLIITQVHTGVASAGDFVFFVQYWDSLIFPLKVLSHEYRFLMANLTDSERLLDLLLTNPSIVDKASATTLATTEARVEFSGVGLSYDGERTILEGVSMTATRGKTIALVGATGAGKSSLMNLLLRYYDVTSGSITIDGQDIRDVTQDSLRNAIGIVPQHPLLFNATIMENLRYARQSASEEEIFEACRSAAIHDRILNFTDGYDSRVGEHGIKLSGGEMQRLAIARVFLQNPALLVLDEATSAVDSETEGHIQDALKRLCQDRTVFVIAHRLSTIIGAAEIIVLDNGSIAERGTHADLLARKEKYHNLWQYQSGGAGYEIR